MESGCDVREWESGREWEETWASYMGSAGTDEPRLEARRGVVAEMLAGGEKGNRCEGEAKEQDEQEKERSEDKGSNGSYDI